MTRERLMKLLEACPELTLDEIKRLREENFKPKLKPIAFLVRLAYAGKGWK